MTRRFFSLFWLAGAASIGTAHATPATDELTAGHYAQAYALAQQAADPLTASSAATNLALFGTPTPAQLEQAIQAAQLATQKLPGNVQAHLNLAAAYGLKASRLGPNPAAFVLARKSKAELDTARTLDTQSPRALAALARWNAEAYARAGILTGANPAQARTLAQQALAHAGNDISVYVTVGQAWLNLKDTGAAKTAFQKALALAPQTAADKAYQAQASGLLGK